MATRTALRQWDDTAATQPDLMARVRERPRTRPRDRSDNPSRTHRLRSPLDEAPIGGVKMPQWQDEMTSGGRVWYCPDPDTQTVWVTRVSLDPPREAH